MFEVAPPILRQKKLEGNSVSQLPGGGKRVGWHAVERRGEAARRDTRKDSVGRSGSEVGFVPRKLGAMGASVAMGTPAAEFGKYPIGGS